MSLTIFWNCAGPSMHSVEYVRTRLLIATFLLFASWTRVGAQDAEPVVPDSATEVSSLDLVKQAIAADADQKYVLLGEVSPRKLSVEERSKAVELLRGLLQNRYPDIRGRAAETIGLFGPQATAAIPDLIELLSDDELKLDMRGVWVSASEALGRIGAEALKPLRDLLPDCERLTYRGVMGALSEMGPDAGSVAPLLIEQLEAGPDDRKWSTMYALSKMGDLARPAIPEYIKQLDHEDFNMQVMACRALAELGPAGKAAVPKLLELVEKGLLSSRTHAVMCLAAMGPLEDVDSVKICMELAEEKNAFSQERSMIALGRLGPHAGKAEPLIQRLIEQDDFSQKPEAAEALWRITGDGKRTIQLLSQWIDSKTYDVRVMDVLTKMGSEAEPFTDKFLQMLSSSDQSLRELAATAISNLGPTAEQHLPALREALRDADRDAALAIDEAIAKIEARH